MTNKTTSLLFWILLALSAPTFFVNMEAFITINALYLITTIPLVALTYYYYKLRLKLFSWCYDDIVLLLMPGILYSFMHLLGAFILHTPKTMANLGELVVLGIITSVVFLLRGIYAGRNENHIILASRISILIVTAITICVYTFVPAIPE